MEEKNFKEMTNAEIQLYVKTLSDKFEATKNKIVALCEELDKLDIEYDKAQNELKARQNNIY